MIGALALLPFHAAVLASRGRARRKALMISLPPPQFQFQNDCPVRTRARLMLGRLTRWIKPMVVDAFVETIEDHESAPATECSPLKIMPMRLSRERASFGESLPSRSAAIVS